MLSDRISRDEMFIQMAATLALRASCQRGHVGAMIVVDGRPAGGGYNGAPSKTPDCYEAGGCDLSLGEEAGCQRAIHAEANAIAWAARHGVRTEGATMYATHSPCKSCAQLIVAAKFRRFVFLKSYRLERLDILEAGDISWEQRAA